MKHSDQNVSIGKFKKIVILVGFSAALFLGVIKICHSYLKYTRLATNGVETEGVVSESTRCFFSFGKRAGIQYLTSFNFQDEKGNTHAATQRTSLERKKGDRISIVYWKKNPQIWHLEKTMPGLKEDPFIFGFISIIVAAFLFLIIRSIRKDFDRESNSVR